MAGGRPTKYKIEYTRQTEKLCRLGANDKDLADFFDVCEDTINEWKEKHSGFFKVIQNRSALMEERAAFIELERAKRRKYRQNSHIKAQQNKYKKDQLKTNPKERLRNNFASLLRDRLKSKTETTFTSLGYSVSELINHLEKQFVEGMTWDNYGSVWHVDHIKPNRLFNYTTVNCEDFRKCWSLDNLQPLFAQDNLKKGGKYASS